MRGVVIFLVAGKTAEKIVDIRTNKGTSNGT